MALSNRSYDRAAVGWHNRVMASLAALRSDCSSATGLHLAELHSTSPAWDRDSITSERGPVFSHSTMRTLTCAACEPRGLKKNVANRALWMFQATVLLSIPGPNTIIARAMRAAAACCGSTALRSPPGWSRMPVVRHRTHQACLVGRSKNKTLTPLGMALSPSGAQTRAGSRLSQTIVRCAGGAAGGSTITGRRVTAGCLPLPLGVIGAAFFGSSTLAGRWPCTLPSSSRAMTARVFDMAGGVPSPGVQIATRSFSSTSMA